MNVIEDRNDIINYLWAGRAVFTLVSRKTKERRTYRARRANGRDMLLVDLLTGADNQQSYTYIGLVRNGGFRAFKAPHPPIAWFIEALYHRPEKLSQVEFWHSGHCAKCGRLLTDPASIARGLGPHCANLT